MQKRKSKKVIKKQKIHLQPPAIGDMAITHGTTLRFVTNAAFQNEISVQNLLDTINVATSATVGFNLFRAVRIRKVELWCAAVSATAPTTIVLVFNGGTAPFVGDQVTHTDTVVGTARAAHVVARPSQKSWLSDWLVTSTAGAFALKVPNGTVVDVSLSFRGPDVNVPAAVQATQMFVGATAGNTLWRGLDGAAIATTVFLPQGVPTG
jgi:hypothetical protein